MKDALTILINGVGGPTPRSVARSIKWHSRFANSTLIGTDINPLAYGLYEKELYDTCYVIPPANKDGYWEAIERIVATHGITIALLQPEKEVEAWAQRTAEGKPLPCPALLPDIRLVQALLDKGTMTRHLRATGLVPDSVVWQRGEELSRFEEVIGFPFWIRATAGSSGLGSLLIKDRAALEQWIAINPTVDTFIGSTYLPGRNLACKLLYWKGRLVRAACAERVHYIMAKVAPSGITGNTSFGRLLNEPDLVEKAHQAMQEISRQTGAPLHGFFTADFKEDGEGRPYITEINVRMVAFNLCFAAAGANFSEDILQLLTNESAFDTAYKMYEFEPGTIFLRDVDATPILMNERDLQ